MEKFGIENLKKLIAIPLELGNIGDAIGRADSKSWKRWLKLMDIFDEAVDLLKVEWSKAKDEYNDLSEEEMLDIRSMMKRKFDIADDELEAKIEKSFDILFNLERIIKESIELFKSNK